jgi:hypothetical protein
LELEYEGVRSGTADLGWFYDMFGKEGTTKVGSTCRFKSKSLLEVKKEKRDGGRKQSFAVVIR